MNDTKKTIVFEHSSCLLCKGGSSTPIAYGYDFEYRSTDDKFTFVKCNRCGHVFLNPRPTPQSAAIIYPSNYYTLEGRHSQKLSLIAYLKRTIIKKRLSYFHELLLKPCKILEIGCGDASLLINLKKNYPDATCIGVDIQFKEFIVNNCKEHAIKLMQEKIEDLELPQNEFDLVIMNQLIEHLWQPEDVLKKIYNCLRPEGMISIETINIDGYDRKYFSNGYWGGYYFPRHLNLFNFKSLKVILDRCGYEVLKQQSLLAPIVWAFSFHAFFSDSENKKENVISRFFSDKNPVCLAIFTFVDVLALLLRLTTSNNKTIAKKLKNSK